MIVISASILFSQLIFTYLMAMITACLTNADAGRARFSDKLILAKRYMEHEGLDSSLRQRVIAYYKYLWQRTKGAVPQELFSSLPRSIWGSVSYCLYGDLIRLCTFYPTRLLSAVFVIATTMSVIITKTNMLLITSRRSIYELRKKSIFAKQM